MQRTIPSTASDEIELYLRTLYSLLRSTTEVQIRSLEEVHASMNSLMHPQAREAAPDTSAFVYSLLRLPDCMSQVRSVVLGQSDEVFAQHDLSGIDAESLRKHSLERETVPVRITRRLGGRCADGLDDTGARPARILVGGELHDRLRIEVEVAGDILDRLAGDVLRELAHIGWGNGSSEVHRRASCTGDQSVAAG